MNIWAMADLVLPCFICVLLDCIDVHIQVPTANHKQLAADENAAVFAMIPEYIPTSR